MLKAGSKSSLTAKSCSDSRQKILKDKYSGLNVKLIYSLLYKIQTW